MLGTPLITRVVSGLGRTAVPNHSDLSQLLMLVSCPVNKFGKKLRRKNR